MPGAKNSGSGTAKISFKPAHLLSDFELRTHTSIRRALEANIWNKQLAKSDAVKYEGFQVPWWLVVLEGIFDIIIGVFLLVSPVITVIRLLQILGFFWLLVGFFRSSRCLWTGKIRDGKFS